MTNALSTHYAEALAGIIFSPDSGIAPEAANEQLKTAADLISSSKDLQRVLLSPAVNKARKQAVVGRLSDELGLHRLLKNFLLVVVSHRRIRELPMMQKNFDSIVDERTGWVPAEITSAYELSANQRQEIERALGAKLGKFVRGHYHVDPSVIGGIRAQVASVQYDATVRGKLDAIRSQLISHL
jgi:F-type H+-transporting ATPase subunit delta